jgi:hypothetical protein
MKLKVFLSLVFLLSLSVLYAQQKGEFNFENEEHDFGSIKEADGPAEHKFVFSNDGEEPIIIQAVRASCGCTTPAWSKEPIAPGQNGFVTAKYNPKNRPGSFRKSLSITSNATQNPKVIYIKGMVENRPRTAADMYRYGVGNLRFKYQSLNMGNVNTGNPMTRSFDLYNDGEVALTFLDKFQKPEYVTLSFEPTVLEPKSNGKLSVTYNGAGKNDFGFVSDPIKIYTDEQNEAEKSLRVVATIEEYFPPMTQEELAQAPKLEFDKTTHDFGSIKENMSVKTEFILTNSGKSELNIRKVKPNCGCTISKLEKYTLQPGDSAKMDVEFNSVGRRGSQQKSIVIFSNDPTGPSRRLVIKAKVANAS